MSWWKAKNACMSMTAKTAWRNLIWGGWIRFRIDGFGLKKRTGFGFLRIGRLWKPVDHGSAVIFDADSRLYLSYVWILNPKVWVIDLSSALVDKLMRSFKLFHFLKEWLSSKLRCETAIGIVLCYSHQACCLLYIWAKLHVTVAFTCTSLPLKVCSENVECGV